MAPAVKVRQFLASKGSSKGPGSDAKVSTPLQRLKLQSRTTIPTSTPGRASGSTDYESTPSKASRLTAEATEAPGVDDRQGDKPQQPGQDDRGTQLKLTLLQVPLLPKPEVTRPAPPADQKALLQRLHDLRTAGENLLASTGAERTPPGAGHTPSAAPYAGTGASTAPAARPAAPSPSPSRWSLQPPSAATAAPASPGPTSFRTPTRPGGRAAATTAATPTASARAFQQPRTPYTRPASPYGGGGFAGFGGAGPQSPGGGLSTPSMAGLRQRELKDTGGGFLTHFADPRDLSTPPPPSRGLGGGGVAAGGSSTPLSVLRSIHRVQQLQRLQREGAQLVACMDGPDAAGHATG